MKVGIVGSGQVGATAAYAMVMNGIGREIVMVDASPERSQAQADDLLHAVPFAHPLDIRAGGYEDLEGSRAVVIAAGVGRQPGESRLQLLQHNAAIFQSMVPRILEHAADAVLVIATNPVDVMTHITAHFAAKNGVPSSRIVGSGTTLDTARLRALLGRRLGIDPHHVHAYVIGEHGDSEVLTWSSATVGGIRLAEYCRLQGLALDESTRFDIDQRVRFAGRSIIKGKGATFYGIGAALARIVDVVLHDQRAVLTVCTPLSEVAGIKDVTVSLPHLLGGSGILANLPVSLDDDETRALNTSCTIVREAIESVMAPA
ncbi:MAG: L-lactate dehydrogenase [Acidobacteria bacterium]|nr:L-lactate dehydrogenase [Acidobacteriota bacterium]MCG3194161.1 L-lactate dehydrogenase [Thermoanaerobaculia bacterium]MCK6684976.1 L-lactate dehydrogenase [Thermoanaerobaculia bacterium]